MGFFDIIKKADQTIFLSRDIEKLEVEIKVAEGQLQNMKARLEHLKEVKREKEMRKR
ncbi:hypothetical protein [Candidatus Nitrosotenuis cloacae]|jgi:hypothetical protein|uniref:hypothetical protein n=1 Tax=Candidatus Nitrosotenuis cloacae TaxID=1603555 RepID=UPI00227DA6BF|nr:hypothetical protein [Candidatus Nitrosotenuis cloacae]